VIEIGGQLLGRQEMRQKCKEYPGGLYTFGKSVLRRNKAKKHLHYAWANYLQLLPPVGQFVRSGGNGPESALRKVGTLPRGHLKSTFLSEALPLWFLSCVDRNLTIALISAHSDNTKKWLRFIKTAITNEGYFRFLYPEIRPGDKWDETEIIVTRDNNDAQASVTALSLQGGLASQHFDIILVDDPVNEQTAASDKEMAKAVEFYIHLEEILRGKKTSALYLIGTPWGREDPLQKAMDEVRAGRSTFWSCGVLGEFNCSPDIADRPELRPDVVEGEFIFPTEFGEYDMHRVKSQDPSGALWNMQYLLKPYGDKTNGFDLKLIREFAFWPDGKLVCDCHPAHQHHLASGSTIMLGDPAYTKNKENCESSLLVANKQPCECRFLLDEWGSYVDPLGYKKQILYMASQWRHWLGGVGLESEALQVTLLQWLVEAKERGEMALSIRILEDIKPKNRNKDGRIAKQIEPVNNGLWHRMPTNRHVEGKNNLLNQLFQWPYSNKRDRADAFGYADDGWKECPVPEVRQVQIVARNINDDIEAEDMQIFGSELYGKDFQLAGDFA